jgi:hypothetical protein
MKETENTQADILNKKPKYKNKTKNKKLFYFSEK